jgi:hypothetical protein
MGTNKITNLVDPTSSQEGATKNYVDNNIEGSSNWSTYPATTDVNLDSYKITNLGAPANAQDATSKRYVDSLAGTPPLKDNLRAYYTFDSDFSDSTGNYDGTAQNGASIVSSPAKIGSALSLDNGRDKKVVINGALDSQDGDFTVATWLYTVMPILAISILLLTPVTMETETGFTYPWHLVMS